MGVRFPKRENPFAKYFSKESPIATTQFEEPKMDNYFSSEDVLGRPTAKNTAQRGMSQSEQMKAAYEELMNPKTMTPKMMSLLEKESTATSDGGTKYPPNTRVFAGAYYDTTPKGELKTETWNIADKMNRGLITGILPWTGGGGWSSGGQTSTSNIAPTGYKPMTMEQASGGFQSKYGTAGTEGQYREFARGSYENIPVEKVNPAMAQKQPSTPLMMGNKPLSEMLYNYNP